MVQVSGQSIYIFMDKTRCQKTKQKQKQKTMKYKRNLSTILLFQQNDKMHLRPFCIQLTNLDSIFHRKYC